MSRQQCGTSPGSGRSWQSAVEVFKPRIGLEIMLAGIAGVAMAGGSGLPLPQLLVLATAVFLAAAGAGALNHLAERDLDARMSRTRARPFVDRRARRRTRWIAADRLAAGACGRRRPGSATNWLAATLRVPRRLHLRRRLHAVAEAADLAEHRRRRSGRKFRRARRRRGGRTRAGPAAWTLAVVLFLWTPPHFWSLAMYYRPGLRRRGRPMLPVVFGDRVAARGDPRPHGSAGAPGAVASRLGRGEVLRLPAPWRAARISSIAASCSCASRRQKNAIRNFLASLLQLAPAARRRHRRWRRAGQSGHLLSHARATFDGKRCEARSWQLLACVASAGVLAQTAAPDDGRRAARPARRRSAGSSATTSSLDQRRTEPFTLSRSARQADRAQPRLHELLLRLLGPDRCTCATSAKVAREALGPDSFTVLTVGFDTPNDTPERMRLFAQRSRRDMPGWNFASADAATMERLARDVGFTYRASPKGFDHITQTTIIDRAGRVVLQVYGQDFDPPHARRAAEDDSSVDRNRARGRSPEWFDSVQALLHDLRSRQRPLPLRLLDRSPTRSRASSPSAWWPSRSRFPGGTRIDRAGIRRLQTGSNA